MRRRRDRSWIASLRVARRCVLHGARGAAYRAQDTHVRAASAQVRAQGFSNFSFRGRRILLEQRLSAHYHARNAIPALRGLRLDESALKRSRVVDRAKTFDRLDLAVS